MYNLKNCFSLKKSVYEGIYIKHKIQMCLMLMTYFHFNLFYLSICSILLNTILMLYFFFSFEKITEWKKKIIINWWN